MTVTAWGASDQAQTPEQLAAKRLARKRNAKRRKREAEYPTETMVSIRTVSGGAPGLGKRR